MIARTAARALLRVGQRSTTAALVCISPRQPRHLRAVSATSTTSILNQWLAPILSIGSAEKNGWSSSSFHERLVVAAVALLAAGGTVGSGLAMMEQQHGAPESAARETAVTSAKPQDSPSVVLNQPPPRPDLPTFTVAEVAEHCDEENGLWYTFRGGVYDMTFFLNGHPGGMPRLLMAAGQDLEPYWHIYRQHFRGHVGTSHCCLLLSSSTSHLKLTETLYDANEIINPSIIRSQNGWKSIASATYRQDCIERHGRRKYHTETKIVSICF